MELQVKELNIDDLDDDLMSLAVLSGDKVVQVVSSGMHKGKHIFVPDTFNDELIILNNRVTTTT